MQFPRSVVSMAIAALLVAACNSGPGATQGPGGGTPTQNPDGGTPTEAPGGGGGVLPGNGSGKVTFEISGPVQKVAELPFFGLGSRFNGPAGKYYAFTRSDGTSTEILSVFPDQSNEGNWLVGYVSEEFVVSATGCVVTSIQTSDSSASGSFDCPNAIVTQGEGSYSTDGRIKGTFEAHA